MQRRKITIRLHKPDLKEKAFFFVSGIIISIPITLFIGNFSDYLCFVLPVIYANLCSIAIFGPLIEEFAKAMPLFYRHGETERSIFTMGFLVGLGFGIFEFFSYVLVLGVPIYIRLPGIFFHAATTSITAYGIAKKRALRFYILAVLFHFSFNFLALLDMLFLITGTTTLAITYYLSWRLYTKTSEKMVLSNYKKPKIRKT